MTVNLRRPFDAGGLQRNFYATSSCGVCGKASIDQIESPARRSPSGPAVPARRSARCPSILRDRQRVFDRTGGLHAAGLFDAGRRAARLREDVGRHNALDKLIGKRLLEGEAPLSELHRAGVRPRQLRAGAEGGGRRHPGAVRDLGARPAWRSRPRAPRRDAGRVPARRPPERLRARRCASLVGAPHDSTRRRAGRGARDLARSARGSRLEAPLAAEASPLDAALGRVLADDLRARGQPAAPLRRHGRLRRVARRDGRGALAPGRRPRSTPASRRRRFDAVVPVEVAAAVATRS